MSTLAPSRAAVDGLADNPWWVIAGEELRCRLVSAAAETVEAECSLGFGGHTPSTN